MSAIEFENNSDLTLVATLAEPPPPCHWALEVLYKRYYTWCFRVAWRACGDANVAEDAAQEAFLVLSKKGAVGLKLTAKLTTYLYPIVTRYAQRSKRKSMRTQATGGDALNVVAAKEAHDTELSQDENLAQVLAKLPEHARQCLLLRYVDGLSLQEIATAQFVSLGTVKARISRALRTLREDANTAHFFEN